MVVKVSVYYEVERKGEGGSKIKEKVEGRV